MNLAVVPAVVGWFGKTPQKRIASSIGGGNRLKFIVMKLSLRCWVAGLLALLLLFPAMTMAAPQLDFVQAMQTSSQDWRGQMTPLRNTADETASKLIMGGHLYVAPTQRSFQLESLGRAGGLMLVKRLSDKTVLTSLDTVLAGIDAGTDSQAVQDLLQRAKRAHAKVLLFAGPSRNTISASKNVQILPTAVFDDVNYAAAPGVESVNNVIGLWSWTAELVACCVRRGHMPAMFTSNAMPGGKERNAQFRKSTFHTSTKVTSASVRHLGSRYLDALSRALAAMIQTQGPAFERGASMIRDAKSKEHQVYVAYMGHMFPHELKGAERPDWQIAPKTQRDANVPSELNQGDVFFFIDYQYFPWELTSALQEQGIQSIITSSMQPLGHWATDKEIVYINPFWKVQDAAVPLAGYDINILPTSGILQSVVYWQLVGLTK